MLYATLHTVSHYPYDIIPTIMNNLKQVLIDSAWFFDKLWKTDLKNIAVFPISSLPHPKKEIMDAIKDRINYKNIESNDFMAERQLLENQYAYLAYFVNDRDANFLNKVFAILPENYRSIELTEENFEAEFHKFMSKDDFLKYQIGMVSRNADYINLKEENKINHHGKAFRQVRDFFAKML